MNASRLPGGRTGRALALLILLLLLALAWQALAMPLLQWHGERAAALEGRRALLARMEALAGSLPALRTAAEGRATAEPGTVPVLAGGTDAVAGAALQQMIGDMAGRAGVSLVTAEPLPAEAAGNYRRLRLRVTLRAPWPGLVALLDAIAGAQPGMVVDDVQIHRTVSLDEGPDSPLDASWTVMAFRVGVPDGAQNGGPGSGPGSIPGSVP